MNIQLSIRRDRGAQVTAAAYNSASDRFDDPALGFWDICGRKTVQLAKLRRGARVLDVGCGTGASALPAAQRVGPRGSVVGIDLAEGLLNQARGKAFAQGLDNVEFCVGDMTELDYPDDSFDAVICVFAIFFVEDMVQQLRRLWRVVRPGGRLAITTWGPGLFEPARSIFWSAIREQRPELERRFSPWDQLTDPRSLRELFAAANVTRPAISVEHASQPLVSTDDWWTIACGTGYRWTIDELTRDEAERVREQNRLALQACGARSLNTDFNCAVARKPYRTQRPLLYWDLF